MALNKWVRRNANMYTNQLVRLYHATHPSLPIEYEGLKPTSLNRRRSYQSTSGYVYLAATPSRAKWFGDVGNMGRSVTYEVVVPIWRLLADRDQLNNQRAVGNDIGNSIGESIVYGGGVRVKGKIEPWAIRQLSADDFYVIEERNRRIWTFDNLREHEGAAHCLWKIGTDAIKAADGDPYAVHWDDVEAAAIHESIVERRHDADSVMDALLQFSPLMAQSKHYVRVEKWLQQALKQLYDTESANHKDEVEDADWLVRGAAKKRLAEANEAKVTDCPAPNCPAPGM
jgi:hypothetical protein